MGRCKRIAVDFNVNEIALPAMTNTRNFWDSEKARYIKIRWGWNASFSIDE